MKEVILHLKDEIRLSYFKSEFIVSINKCNKLIESSNDNDVLWFAFYMKALSYKQLADIDNALKYSVKAIHCY